MISAPLALGIIQDERAMLAAIEMAQSSIGAHYAKPSLIVGREKRIRVEVLSRFFASALSWGVPSLYVSIGGDISPAVRARSLARSTQESIALSLVYQLSPLGARVEDLLAFHAEAEDLLGVSVRAMFVDSLDLLNTSAGSWDTRYDDREDFVYTRVAAYLSGRKLLFWSTDSIRRGFTPTGQISDLYGVSGSARKTGIAGYILLAERAIRRGSEPVQLRILGSNFCPDCVTLGSFSLDYGITRIAPQILRVDRVR